MLAPLQTGSRTLHPTRQAASFIKASSVVCPQGRAHNHAAHNPPLRQASPPLPSLRGEGGIDACPSAGVLNPRSSLARNLYLPISIPSSHTDTLTIIISRLPIKTPVATFFDYTDRAPPGLDGCVAPHGPSPTHRGTTCRPTPWTSRTEVIWRLRLQAVQVQERLHLLLGLQDIAARRDNVAVTHALFRASCPHPVPHTPSRWQHEMLPRANWATSPFPSGENLYDQSIA